MVMPREDALRAVDRLALQVGNAHHASLRGSALASRCVAALSVSRNLKLDDARLTAITVISLLEANE